jgi:hypothetical protein
MQSEVVIFLKQSVSDFAPTSSVNLPAGQGVHF